MHQTISWEIIQSVLDIFNKSSDQLRGVDTNVDLEISTTPARLSE
jgi:hypothetical protein